jgi:hypothetical protein
MPSIRQTIYVLNFEAPLPLLPSNIPEPPRLASAMNRLEMSLSMSSGSNDYDGGHNQNSSNSYTNFFLLTSSSITSQFASLLHTR